MITWLISISWTNVNPLGLLCEIKCQVLLFKTCSNRAEQPPYWSMPNSLPHIRQTVSRKHNTNHSVCIPFIHSSIFMTLECSFFENRQQCQVFITLRYGPMSDRSSVCLSVTSRCSIKIVKYIIKQTIPHDNVGTLIFLWLTDLFVQMIQ